jgi:phage terminase large subunit GpA-like protein
MRLDRTPYIRGILDTLASPNVREVWLMKCVQSAGSEATRSFLGWSLDVAPGPTLIVFPNEASARETIDQRVWPMIKGTPQLARYITGRGHDIRKDLLKLAHTDVYIGWSGSPQALASRPIRVLVLDEVDKFATYNGKEAGSIDLAIDRTTTYAHRRKIIGLSTPTIPTGNIAKRFDEAGWRCYFAVPCLGCGEGMKPDFAQVKWPERDTDDEDELRAMRAALEGLATRAVYECEHCDHAHTDREYRQQVKSGEWVGEGYETSEIVGFHVHGLISPWLGVQRLALEYVTAKLGGLSKLQNFHNSYLGVPFWDESIHGSAETQVGAATIWRKSRDGGEAGVVPKWAHVLVCGADSKKRGHYYVVRAFGSGWRSQLIDYGETSTSEELTARVFRDWPKEKGGVMRVRMMCVDTGGGLSQRDASRSDELYRYTKSDPAHIKAVRGYGGGGTPSQPIVTTTRQYVPPGGQRMPYDITVSTLDVGYFKDVLAARINDEEDPDLWLAFQGVGRDYVQQMSSERKILVERRIRHGEARDIWRWQPRTAGAANHLWDSEVYCLAAAHMLDVDKIQAQTQRKRRPRRSDGMGWATNY